MKQAKQKDLLKRDYLLSLEQISNYCGTPIKRINNWVENRGLKVARVEGNVKKVRIDELIDFLVRHNEVGCQ